MGNDEGGAVLHQLVEPGLHRALGLGVQRRGGLIQNQNGCVFEHRARDGDPLFLPARELEPALTNDGVISLGEGTDEGVGVRPLGDGDYLLIAGPRLAIGDVFPDRARKQLGLLEDHADGRTQAGGAEIVDLVAEHA